MTNQKRKEYELYLKVLSIFVGPKLNVKYVIKTKIYKKNCIIKIKMLKNV